MKTHVRIVATFLFMTAGSLVMLAVAIPTLFMARRFYSEVMARWLGRMVLRIWGVRYRVHGALPEKHLQTVFISNHTSTLDVFLLIALGLPRTRFFLSGFLKKVPPIGIVGTLIRIFWTVPQTHPAQRRAIFKRANRVLRYSGDSVYLSPEGMRVTTGEIGHFNKGAFHLATSLHAPIVPIYFAIPRDIDPGRGYAAKPGMIDLYFLPPIDTRDWSLADLDRNREDVRNLFVRVHETMRTIGVLRDVLMIDTPRPQEALV